MYGRDPRERRPFRRPCECRLNVLAGPMSKWRFNNCPDHEWVIGRDIA